jgi:hypothetical protein
MMHEGTSEVMERGFVSQVPRETYVVQDGVVYREVHSRTLIRVGDGRPKQGELVDLLRHVIFIAGAGLSTIGFLHILRYGL